MVEFRLMLKPTSFAFTAAAMPTLISNKMRMARSTKYVLSKIPLSFAAPKQPKNETIVTIIPMTMAAAPIEVPMPNWLLFDEVSTLPPPIRINPASYRMHDELESDK